MDTSDWAVIGAVSVLGFTIIHIALFAFWIDIRNEIRVMRAELKTGFRAAGARVSDAELEQARMQGVMSVIRPQAHDHARESAGTRRNPPADSQGAPPNENDSQSAPPNDNH